MVWSESFSGKDRNNAAKSKKWAFSKNSRICIDRQQLKACNKVKYLGTVITDNALLDKEVQTRIQRAKAVLEAISESLDQKKTVRKNKSQCVSNNDSPNSTHRTVKPCNCSYCMLI